MLGRIDAAGDRLFAKCFAGLGSAALVDIASQAIDQPGGFVGRTFKSDVSGSNRRYQGRQQNTYADNGGADDRR